MSAVDFGEPLNSQEMLRSLQSHAGKGHAAGTSHILNDKNVELLKKLNETKHELCLLLLEVSAKWEQVYCGDYAALLNAELARMQAVEKKTP